MDGSIPGVFDAKPLLDACPMLPCLAPPETPALPLHTTTPAELEACRAGLPAGAAGILAASGFVARPGQLALLPAESGLVGAVVGLGDGPVTPHSFGALAQTLPEGTAWRLAAPAGLAEAATLGWCLGAYRFTRFKAAARAPARLVPPPGSAAAIGTAETAWRVRDLINTPANLLGPAELAAAIASLAAVHGASCEIIEGPALAAGFPALHAVGAGATYARAPRVALLEWRGPGADDAAPLVALCGKGVCFDTGGLDLKPSAGMLRMKKDMGGAAIMSGVAELLMRAALPIRLLLLVGAVENAVSAESFRPGDVIRTRAGLSVEIGNTDAEGRLVLADALHYAAQRFRPRALVDLATLTGAVTVALGRHRAGLFGSDPALLAQLKAAGAAVGEPLWPLPIGAAHREDLRSDIADLKQCGTGRLLPDASHAAAFLREFVGTTPWAHLDIAGVAQRQAADPTEASIPTGFGVRLLDRLVADAFEDPPA
jgi:leucyl aminopeptidase